MDNVLFLIEGVVAIYWKKILLQVFQVNYFPPLIKSKDYLNYTKNDKVIPFLGLGTWLTGFAFKWHQQARIENTYSQSGLFLFYLIYPPGINFGSSKVMGRLQFETMNNVRQRHWAFMSMLPRFIRKKALPSSLVCAFTRWIRRDEQWKKFVCHCGQGPIQNNWDAIGI